MKTSLCRLAFLFLSLMTLLTSCLSNNSSKEELPVPQNIASHATCARCPVVSEPAPYILEKLPFVAEEVTASANNVAFLLSAESPGEANGHKIYYKNLFVDDSFTYLPSPGAIYFSASGCQRLWIVTATGELYYNDFSTGFPSVWVQFSANNQPLFSAVSAVNDDRRLFALGAQQDSFGEYPVYLYDQTSNSWSQRGTQGGQRLIVDGAGRPWITTNTGKLYRSAGYSQTFSGWNDMSTPNNAFVEDVVQFRFTTNSTPIRAIGVLARGFSTSSVFWQEYPFTTTQTLWDSSLGGTGTRITTSSEMLWLLSGDGNVWHRQL